MRLDKKEIEYTVVDVTNDNETRESLRKYGLTSMPIVVAGDDVWGGFKPHLIDALAN